MSSLNYYLTPSFYTALIDVSIYDRPSEVLGERIGYIAKGTPFEIYERAKYSIKDRAYFFPFEGAYISASMDDIEEIDSIVYVAAEGDTFETIAFMFGVDVELLIERNPMLADREVRAGDTLAIPL